MAYDTDKVRSEVRRAALLLILCSCLVPPAFAQKTFQHLQVEPRIYLTGMTSYVNHDDDSMSYQSMIPAAELRLFLPARRWYASLFAEHRISEDDRFDDITNLGAYWKYNLDRWDVTTYLFVNVTPQSSQTWYYAGRLRYQLADNHKLGVEAAGVFSGHHSPALAASYYASLGDALTLKLVADPGINGGPDFAARAELMWQVH